MKALITGGGGFLGTAIAKKLRARGDEVVSLKDGLIQFRADHREGVKELQGDTPHRARFPAGAHRRAQELKRILAAYRAKPPPAA